MASQQFSLKWHSHCQHLANSFNILRSEDEFLTDVTLCCEGKRLKAHKIILSVCSTYFRETFMENPCKHPVVIFKNVKFDDLTSIVEFMYKGEVSISQDSLSSFLHVAEMLQVRGLSENQEIIPEKSLIQPVSQPESLFISVPEGNKILLATPQNISSNQQQQTSSILKSPIKIEPQQVQHIKTTFLDQSGIGGKRKRFTIKETRPAKIAANNSNTNATTAQQFIAEAVDNSFGKQETVIVDENGKESVFEEVEYLTMKSGMPEYVVSAIENAEQSQDNMEEMTLMQETFEIIEEGKQQMVDDVGNETAGEEQAEQMQTSNDGQDAGSEYRLLSEDSSKSSRKDSIFLETEEKSGEEANSKWTQCQYCKLVITSVNLWRHVRTQHTSQPPRKCEYCKKTFKNKYSLREHVRISHESKNASKGDGDSDEQPQQTQPTASTTTTSTTTSQPSEQTTAKVIYLEKVL